MDVIGVARAGVGNVVASCGTSLTEAQVALLKRATQRVVVNFDPDLAGQAATERSLNLLLEQQMDVRVLALSGGYDPDKFIRERGADEYTKLLNSAPAFVDFLITRARAMDLSSAEGKLKAVNYLMPYIQRVPNRLIRSEWATRIASQLRIEEPVLREAFRKAAAERKSEVKPKAELIASGPKPAERRLLRLLLDAEGFRVTLARELRAGALHAGLETQKIFDALLAAVESGERPDPAELGKSLSEKDRRLLYEIAFEPAMESSWEEAESCLAVLRRRHIEAELFTVQQRIEANPPADELRTLLARKSDLRRLLASL
jgi:DNA primase